MTDQGTNGRIEDAKRLSLIKDQVRNVLRAANADIGDVQLLMEFSSSSKSLVHKERRLHQIMLADRDHRPTVEEDKENIERHKNVAAAVDDHNHKPSITVENCNEKGYSVVNIACKDRPKLLFDIVCTLTDMQYAVFHACIRSDGHQASQVSTIPTFACFALSVSCSAS
jgi:UTP:GlnB (protein PII) uridylyltransferase